jgi:hypothetical protein
MGRDLMPPVIESVTSDVIVLSQRSKSSEADSWPQMAQNEEPKLIFSEMAEMRKKRVEEVDGAA